MKKAIPFQAWTLWITLLAASWGGASGIWSADETAAPLPEVFISNLGCNDTINITLNEECRALITADMVLEGEMGCLTPSDFDIYISDDIPGNGPQLDGYGIFQYEVRLKPGVSCDGQDFSTCWGYLRAEDKTPPVLDCPDDRDQAYRNRPLQRIAGLLDAADQKFDPGNLSCYPDRTIAAGDHRYDLFSFSVTEKAVYTFELSAEFGTPLAGIYQKEFNPAEPCKRQLLPARLISDGKGYFLSGESYRLSIELLPGRNYVLFTSSEAAGVSGNYLWAVYNSGGARIEGLPVSERPILLPLFCENADSVLNNPKSTAYLGAATATDNCGLPQLIDIRDELRAVADCEDRILERRFTFRDKKANEAACTQEVRFRQPGFSDVVLPPQNAYIGCDEAVMLDDNGHPHPMVSGRPFILSAFGPIFLDTVTCGIGASYSDESVQKQCADTRLIRRLWKIVNWCDNESEIFFTQRIIVGDFVEPSFDCPAPARASDELLTFSTGPFSCFAAFEVPLPQNIRDNCSDSLQIDVEVLLNGTELMISLPHGSTDYYISGVPPGVHAFRYTVRDECGNQRVRDCDFLVVDEVNPIAVCDDSLTVSMGGAGIGSITAADVDEGSWDNCDADPELHIRRVVSAECLEAYRSEIDTMLTLDPATGLYYTPWRNKLEFICCEVGTYVKLELRVTDDGGLTNTCWQEVLIEDKIAPICKAPVDRSIVCDSLTFINEQDTTDLQAYFGKAGAEDNCTAVVRELEPELNRDNCGTGTLIRRFQAVDGYGNESAVCTQTISLTKRHNYEIKFPKDIENFSCGEIFTDSIEVNELACDVLAVSRDTTYFETDDAACFKMFIRYRVINWCEYEDGQSPVVIGRDEDGDGVPGDEAVYVLRRPPGPDSTYIDSNNDEGDGFFRTETSVGFWEYTQMIKVYDNTPPDIVMPPWQGTFCALNGCETEIDLLFDIVDNCINQRGGVEYDLEYDENDDGNRQNLDVTLYLKGRYPKQRISGDFPIGRHAFYLTITDHCGNINSERIPFEVIDCKPPAPICIERLAVELMPLDTDDDGQIDSAANTVWVSDFIASETFDCSGVTYSINRAGEEPNVDLTSITVTCSDPDILPVEVYAWDTAYNPESVQPNGTIGGPNYSKCYVKLYVQDNRFNLCGDTPGASIAGLITTEQNSAVAGVTVSLSGQSSQTIETDESGNYRFNSIFEGYDYSIVPQKDDGPLNGVTTFDLLLITKHILGVKKLDSPYKLIAADINRSGSVSTLDLIQARKLILGTAAGFPNNSSWRFVRADHDFPYADNPWADFFPELVNINNLSTLDPLFYDFIALKVGDVNASAAANNLDAVEERRDRPNWEIVTVDQELQAGEVYRVDLRARDLQTIEGFQFTLDFDASALSLLHLEHGLLQEAHTGDAFLEAGRLTASWNRMGDAPIDERLLTLSFRAHADGRLSDFLQINSGFTPAEAYHGNGDLLDVELAFETPAEQAFELYPNQPNPFRTETLIRFALPEAQPVLLKVTDTNGRLLYERRIDGQAGYNEWPVHSADLPASGVLFYTLETREGAHTRKMIRLGGR